MKPALRAFAILMGFLLIAGLMGLPEVSAQSEYTAGTLAMARTAFSEPLDSRVACKDDYSACVAIVYENNTFYGRGARVKYSTGYAGKHFESLFFGCSGLDILFGCIEILSETSDYSSWIGGYFDDYHLPYDVVYDPDMDQFNFFVDNNAYSYDGVTLTNHGAFECNRNADGECWASHYTIDYPQQVTMLEVHFGTSDYPITQLKSFIGDGGGTSKLAWSGGNAVPYAFGDWYNGSMLTVGNSNFWLGASAVASPQIKTYGLGSFPTTYSGIHYHTYEASGQVVFNRDDNATWETYTTDFSSFSGTALLYNWDNSINESIFNADAIETEIGKLITYSRETNTTGSGVYFYNRILYPFKILATGLNMDTLSAESISISATVVCLATNYTSTSGGVNPTVSSECDENNSVYITASGWNPSSILLTDIDSLTGSGYTFVSSASNNLGWINDYNFTVGVFDSFSGEPVSGASVTIGGDTEITDSLGYAYFVLSPYTDENFVMTESGNTYYLALTGLPLSYFAEVSSSGYISDTISFQLTSVTEPTDVSDFSKLTTIQLEPIHAKVLVDVYWKDGVHYDGDTVVVRMGGANNGTQVQIDGINNPINYAIDFPAIFILQDDRSSWTANINMTSASDFQSDTISVVNTTVVYTKNFFLDNTSAEQECLTDLGCASSFCKGSIFYSDGSCESGVCIYDLESCVLCDDDAGCYTSTTTQTCPSGLDVECYGSNYCIDTKYLASFRCSSAKLCYMDTVECGYVCNQGEDVCIGAGAVAECDQSTVTGLLVCVQAGIMSFVGSTYDPAFAIGLVLFISIILIAIFVAGFLAVKGAMSARR